MPHSAVRAHWESEPCGTRGLSDTDRLGFFHQLETERYVAEPYIPRFARFDEHRGQRVLEVGVGAGTDFVQWVRHGAKAVGVDLTSAGTRLTKERLGLERHAAPVLQADAEQLPFADGCIDVVYSYGVLHHSSDTNAAFAEAHRVLKPGGKLRVMIYHSRSIGGALLGLRWRMSPKKAIARYLESPGTRCYTRAEARALVGSFKNVSIQTVLGSGDLLLMRPSARHAKFAWVWRLYPRWLIRRCATSLGFFLLIDATR